MTSPVNLLDYDRAGMEAFLESMGEKPFRATQLLKWIHQFGVDDFDIMTNLSKELRSRLRDNACVSAPEMVSEQISTDGTRKWLLRLSCGDCVETVFIPEDDRGTLCISSQIGCALDCSFCSTARQGFNRNLTVGEIVGQLWVACQRLQCHPKKQRKITNVVLMGMGEPLLNFDNVVRAMDLMMDDFAYSLARRKITLSTSGMVPGIDKLRRPRPVSLAISLHAPDDTLRNQLVPINRKYPVAELMAACRRYVDADEKHEAVTFEYVMLDGVNDSPACARQLVKCLQGMPAKVNLIPFNPFPDAPYRCSGIEVINQFRAILVAAGIVTVTRKTRGEDIDAACGQLVGRVDPRGMKHRKLKNQSMEMNL